MRKLTRLYQNNQLIKTRIYAGNYEKVSNLMNGDVKEFNYISGPNGLIAVYIVMNGTGTLYYTVTDHLGSIVQLIDANGTVIEETNYDPWGRYRDPNTWQYDNTTGLNLLHRGYTGHEMLPEFGLIHMNGRMYDPLLGRMLSPDNYVQNPNNPNNYNRYAYCYNNPLKYTDPDGEFVWFVVGGAVLGSYIGGSITAGDGGLTNANWNPFGGKAGSWAGTDWWKGAITGAMVGAGAGALTAATLGGTATTSLMTAASGEGASLGWSISSSALLSSNINIASNFAQGRGVEGTWKAGLIGLGTGALGAYTSYGLTGSKLASDLGLSKEGISAISHSLASGTYGFIDRNIRLREEGVRGWELFGYSMLGFVEGAGIGAQAGGVWSGNLLTQTALSSGITSFPAFGYSIMNYETLTLFSKINESTPKYPNELTLDKIVGGIISMF